MRRNARRGFGGYTSLGLDGVGFSQLEGRVCWGRERETIEMGEGMCFGRLGFFVGLGEHEHGGREEGRFK